ncbi:MAG: hypothetical protein IKF98_00410 [Clostridia bacterium]|nr:hypothetical protein [Clostridia bacterium]
MITTDTGAKKIENSDNWRQIFDAHNDSVDAEDKIVPEMAPIVNGNKSTVGAAIGEYVLVRNSSITGITDGAYTAAKAIPANTTIDSTYLTAVGTGGALNALNSKLGWTYIDSKQGTTSIDLPSNAKEYLFILRFATSGGSQPLCFEFTVPNSASLWNAMTLTDGYYNAANSYGFGQVTYSQWTHTANIAVLSINGVNYTSTSYLYAFYR